MSSLLNRWKLNQDLGISNEVKNEDGEFSKGLSRAWENTKATTKAAIGAVTGAEDYLLAADFNQREAQRYAPNVAGFTDIRRLSDAGDWLAGTAGEATVDIGTMLGGGGVGGLAARGGVKLLGGAALKEAAQFGTMAGLVGTSYPQQFGENIQAVREEHQGQLPEGSVPTLALTAIAQTALDTLPVMGVLGKLGLADKARSDILANTLKSPSRLRQIGRDLGGFALKEAGTEATQEAMKLGALEWIDSNKDHFGVEQVKQLVNSFAAGAVGGTLMGAPVAGLNALQSDRPWFRQKEQLKAEAIRRFEDTGDAAQLQQDAADIEAFVVENVARDAGKSPVQSPVSPVSTMAVEAPAPLDFAEEAPIHNPPHVEVVEGGNVDAMSNAQAHSVGGGLVGFEETTPNLPLSGDKQGAPALGVFGNDPANIPDTANAPDARRAATLYDADNNEYKAEYDIIDAATLNPAIDKADNQYRDRNRKALQAQVDKIAANPIYGRLNTQHSTFTDGAPVLTQDEVLVAGNGRMAGLKQAYGQGTADSYRQQLTQDAGRLGFDTAAIEQMQQPVLVRRLQGDANTKKLAVLSNVGTGASMSQFEQAKVDAEYINNLRDFNPDDAAEINFQSAPGLFQRLRAAVPEAERNSIMTADGKVSADGARRVRNALMFMAYGDTPVLANITESQDPEHISITKALVQAAPKLAEMRDNIKQGISYDADITPDIVEGFSLFKQIRRDDGNTIESWLNQQDAFSKTPETVKSIIRRMDAGAKKPSQLRDFLNAYADKLKAYGNPNQQGMFGGNPTPTKQEVLQRAERDTYQPDNPVAATTTQQRPAGTGNLAPAGAKAGAESRVAEADTGGYGRSGIVGYGATENDTIASPNQLTLFYANGKAKADTSTGSAKRLPTNTRSPDAGGVDGGLGELADERTTKAIVEQAQSADLSGEFATITRLILGQDYWVSRDTIKTHADAAMVFNDLLGNRAREALDVIVLDRGGKLLALQRMSTGTIDGSNVYPEDIIRFVSSIPAAASFYTGHNHPSGKSDFSTADHRITGKIERYSEKLPFKFLGMFAIGNSEYSYMPTADNGSVYRLNKPSPIHPVSLLEHVIEKRDTLDERSISAPDVAVEIVRGISKGRDGIVLLNSRNYAAAFIPLDLNVAKKLAFSPEAIRILASVSRSNAAAAIITTKADDADTKEAALNVSALLNKAGVRVIDVLHNDRSQAEFGYDTNRDHEAMYSRKDTGAEPAPNNPAGRTRSGLSVAGLREELVARFGAGRVKVLEKAGRLRLVQGVDELPSGNVSSQVEAAFASGKKVVVVGDGVKAPDGIKNLVVLRDSGLGRMAGLVKAGKQVVVVSSKPVAELRSLKEFSKTC